MLHRGAPRYCAVVHWCTSPLDASAAASVALGGVPRNSQRPTMSGAHASSWRAIAPTRCPPPARMFQNTTRIWLPILRWPTAGEPGVSWRLPACDRRRFLGLGSATAAGLVLARVSPARGAGLTLASIKESGKLRIGVEAAYVPFTFRPEGKIVGYDIDLADITPDGWAPAKPALERDAEPRGPSHPEIGFSHEVAAK